MILMYYSFSIKEKVESIFKWVSILIIITYRYISFNLLIYSYIYIYIYYE